MAIPCPKLPQSIPALIPHDRHRHSPPSLFSSSYKANPVRTLSAGGREKSKITRLPSAMRDDSATALSSILAELEVLNQEEGKRHYPLTERWREIQGVLDWAGLLDPMDPLLRAELIRYGEFAQACYDAFDYDPFSRYCGSCKYNRRKFFPSLGMAACGYEVTRYLYATSNITLPNFFTTSRAANKTWSQRANWIGYVAVASDVSAARLGRRDIVVAWRGTITRLEWVADLMDFLRPVADEGIPCPDESVKVESGFADLYTDKDPNCRFCKYSAREQVLTEVRKLVDHYTNAGEEVSISVTGHSLGSALAMLSAYDIAETGANVGAGGKRTATTVFSFSGPRVGNGRFKERFEGLGVKALRIVNVHDTVPKVPGIFINERMPESVRRLAEWLPWSYSHVGVELALDHKHSPFLKETSDPSCFHNLEAHLHLLDGYHGKGKRFVLASGRDPALVNKACDFLKDHHQVPPFWRQDENKGMIRAHDGRWMQAERQKMDDHPPDTHHHLRLLGLHKDN
ncbi:phospholipase A1-Igamma1, chloroplastic-like [Typha angustifolia]|uniref:phospholipase A1-Igamma1, chloroplastic-like n=1 Tax=Typha angustifolia TaxID=59011 RepID=UPI003C2DC555